MTLWERQRRLRFTRRAVILGGVQGALTAALAARLYQLQVVENEAFSTLAEKNRISVEFLAPLRGQIYDRAGVPMAQNRLSYRLLLVPTREAEAGPVLERLAALLEDGGERLRPAWEEVRRGGRQRPVVLADDISWEEVTRVAAHTLFLPGVSIERYKRRHYPDGHAAAHLVGYVSRMSSEDLQENPDLAQVPDYQIGKNGLERTHERDMRGSAGVRNFEVDVRGRVIRNLDHREETAGSDLHLTIDGDLQRFVQDRMGEESGAAVVLDVHTGEALACCSSPSFDPNVFARGMDLATWNRLQNDPRRPLNDKTAHGVYPPGSVFKLVVALAALERDLVDPMERIECSGRMVFGNRAFHCWREEGHGEVNLRRGLARSCDIYFYQLALRVGIDGIAEMARRLGLGAATAGGQIAGERTGLVPTRAWKMTQTGEPWQKGETLNVGIGQGQVLATPLQLALMTARLVNGGKAVGIRFLRGIGDPPAAAAEAPPPEDERPEDLGIQPASLAFVRKAMEDVVNHQRGTAYASRIAKKGFRMAGKTGTSQVRRITAFERVAGVVKNEDLAWEQRDHGVFVGYAPADHPRYAVAVVVEHGGSGSTSAAPVARDILLHAQRRHVAAAGAGEDPS